MKKYGSKFLLILALTLLGLYSIWPPGQKLKTGIDLSGGTILVYEVNQGAGNTAGNVNLDELITALKRRVNPEGVLDIPIRKIGNNRLEIILPKAAPEEVEEVKRKMTNVGSLEFRILANHKHDAGVIDRAMGPAGFTKPPSKYRWAKAGETITGENPTLGAGGASITDASRRWMKNSQAGRTVYLTGKTAAGLEKSEEASIEGNTSDTLTLARPHGLATVASYRIEFNPSRLQGGMPDRPMPMDPILREEKVGPGHVERYVLYKIPPDRQDVTGKLLAKAEPQQDDHFQPAVGFTFNRLGGRKFGNLTNDHLPEEGGAFKYQLAILLDGVIQSAPSINSEIRDSGIIEGGAQGFSPKELNFLISVLRSGSLPASLNPEPLQEENVGATLGEDTIARGLFAILVSMIVVPAFMIVYYRFAGVVAVVALVLNILLLVASMAFFEASFTLPGLAGLALTIGMAVDVNVLIFERMREEAERGASMAQQIRNGFNRAWVTIFDSHVTIFLSGLVLYTVGTDEVKGFALTLIIGMIWNLFTAVYVSRLIFEYWYDRGWLRKLSMFKINLPRQIDFISPRKACMVGSIIVIALGLVATAARGRGMYNIDFTGGTLVTIRLNEQDPQVKGLSDSARTAFVRSKANLPDVTVESLSVGGEKAGERFNIRTTEQKIDKVKATVLDSFGSALQRVELAVGTPAPIAAAAAPATPAPAPADAAKADAAKAAPADRFAGGRQYPLTFNLPQSATQVAASFRNVLQEGGINVPDARFEVINPKAVPGATTVLDSKDLTLRTNLEPDVAQGLFKKLAANMANDRNLLFERSETFGSTVAGETQSLAIIATVASWLIIAGYLWVRFKSLVYGLAAIIAVVHDVLITLGAIAVTYWLSRIPGLSQAFLLEPFKIDLPMIAAFLTLIGFSVNDTIVIFDRIRELKGKSPVLTAKMINDALNQTLSRTILTSLTAWLVVVILYILGGEGLHGFAFSLVVGFLSGTYSTIYIASPILIDWDRKAIPATAGAKELVTAR